MTLDLTRDEIDHLWDSGYRPFEVYLFNSKTVEYYGETMAPGTVGGWEIAFVFSTRENLKTFPFFDAVIAVGCLENCETVWHGGH